MSVPAPPSEKMPVFFVCFVISSTLYAQIKKPGILTCRAAALSWLSKAQPRMALPRVCEDLDAVQRHGPPRQDRADGGEQLREVEPKR